MALLTFGTNRSEFIGTTSTHLHTTNATLIGPYVRSGISVDRGDPTLYLEFVDQSDVWVSFYNYSSGFATSYDMLRFYDDFGDQGQARVRTGSSDATILEIWLWDGSVWQSQATSATGAIVAATKHRIDVHLKIDDSTGIFEVFVDGVSKVAVTSADTLIDTPTTVNTTGFRGYGTTSNTDTTISTCMIWDEDCRTIWYNDLTLDGNGANTAWAGDYTDIDEVEFDSTDRIRTTADDQEETYTHAGKHADFSANHTVETIGIIAHARKGSTGTSALQGMARHNSVNGETQSFEMTEALLPYRFQFTENPDTASTWALGDVDSAEFGVKSEQVQVDVSQLNIISVYENKAELTASQLNIITVYESTAEVMATQLNIITVYEDTS